MKKVESRRRWRMRSRVFLLIAALLAAVFLSVFLSFNLFLKNYIRSTACLQLDKAEQTMEETSLKELGYGKEDLNEAKEQMLLPDLSRFLKKKGLRSEAMVFNLDSGYEVIDYDENADLSDVEIIADYLKGEKIQIKDAQHVYADTVQGKYYVSSIRDSLLHDRYMVFYIDATQSYELADTINLALAAIVAVAMLICLFIANMIAKTVNRPVEKLSEFAEGLGRGNFGRKDFEFRDIEFEELAQALNGAAEKLDEYDREQKFFFQNVSHELRTPLMSIRCYAEGISCGVMNPKQSCDVIISEAVRLSEMVDELLYISRIDTQNVWDKKQEGDLRETVSMCASGLWAEAEKSGIVFKYEFCEDAVLFAYNENHMCRAVNNLISNALRYARSTVTLRCIKTSESVEISVADDGDGITDEDLPHIFDRFYKGRGGKNGIGLSIAKSIVELHEGTIFVDCSSGTCFTAVFSNKVKN